MFFSELSIMDFESGLLRFLCCKRNRFYKSQIRKIDHYKCRKIIKKFKRRIIECLNDDWHKE